MIIITITILQTILFIGHYFFYRTFVYFFGITNTNTLFWIKIVLIGLSLSFTLASLLSFSKFSLIGRIFYTGSAVWLGTLYWLVLVSFLIWIIYGFLSVFFPNFNIAHIAKLLIIFSFIISIYGVHNSYQTKIVSESIEISNLPNEWEDKKIILISDTHFGNIRNVNFAKKIVTLINNQKPDIFLIAGDFFDGTPLNTDIVTEVFSSIKSTHGVYFGSGNHEEYGNTSLYLDSLKRANIQVLDNQKINIDGVQLIGVNYSSTNTEEKKRIVLSALDIDPNIPSIIIKHVPNDIQVLQEFGIDLQVSGHTHKGQVFPFNYITKSIYGKFHYGLNSLGETQVYTTSGVGTWGPPQRFGTSSEVIVIKLKNKK